MENAHMIGTQIINILGATYTVQVLDSLGDGLTGDIDVHAKQIRISRVVKDHDTLIRTIAHEISHAVQYEGGAGFGFVGPQAELSAEVSGIVAAVLCGNMGVVQEVEKQVNPK